MTIHADAIFSSCRTFRYALMRWWDDRLGSAVFIGLNPSTADETTDDPTIRRCVRFARDWGYGGVVMANLFAFRATKPADMKRAADPVGPQNDRWLKTITAPAGITVAAWGNHGTFRARDMAVRDLGMPLHYLRLTKAGQPEHPLYLPASLEPKLWMPTTGWRRAEKGDRDAKTTTT